MERNNILHICNDFSYTKVHKNLYSKLDAIGFCQIIFHPLRNYSLLGINHINFKNGDSSIVYSKKISRHHKIIFEAKTRFLYKSLLNQINPLEIRVVSATTLFSDGVLAYKLFKEFNIPYTVTVRNTDIHIFLKYRPDLILLASKILNNAVKVIFISKSNYENFFKHRLIKGRPRFKINSEIINNGVDDFWLENQSRKRIKEAPTTILFIGKFDENKNILKLLEAFKAVKKHKKNIELNIVGAGGENEQKVIKIAKKDNSIKMYGRISSRKELQDIFKESHIFALTSFRETFGLVYLEALSQGLPVLYTKNQGIDGTFKENFGVSVNPMSVQEISKAILLLIDNYHDFQMPLINKESYGWENIADRYRKIYESI